MTPDRRQARTDAVRREAERAGFRDDCPECARYLATTGAEACPDHYRPIRERTDRRRTS